MGTTSLKKFPRRKKSNQMKMKNYAKVEDARKS
jgi:hypothetical protein